MKRVTIAFTMGMIFLLLPGQSSNSQELVPVKVTTSAGCSYVSSDTFYELPDDWADNFRPAGGSMQTERSTCTGNIFFSVEFDFLSVKWEKWCIGIHAIPVSFYYPGGFNKQRLEQVELDWWDPVMVQTTSLQMAPAVGSFVRVGREGDIRIGLQFLVQPFSVVVEDFRGEDRAGERNVSSAYREDKVHEGVAFRIETTVFRASSFSLGMFFQSFGTYSQVWGVTMGYELL